MITADVAQLAMLNLADTYAALGQEVEGSRLVRAPGYCACTGELPHGICNFAVTSRFDERMAYELYELGRGRRVFNIYLSGHEAERQDRTLDNLGLARSFQLVQMIAEETPLTPDIVLEADLDRHQVASFMIGEFFPALSGVMRKAVVEATAGAHRLQLLGLREGGRLIGGAMLSEAAGMLSLYNLCVAASHQERGYGTAIVESLVLHAQSLGLPFGLQCDVRLEPWYQKRGFASIGTVEVFVLPNAATGAIMN